jgi:uncharacterized protein YggE
MKKTLLLISLLLCSISIRAGDLDVPHVSVFGTAVIEVVPDEMHWTLFVKTQGPEIASVAETHDRKVAGVISFLKDRSIDEKKIQTSRITLAENWVYRANERVMDGYIASTTVVFESNKLEQYRDLWIGVANLKDVSVNSVEFDTSERIKHQNNSRIQAVRAAKDKAISLAEALDSNIGHPLVIDEVMAPTVDYSGRAGLANNRMAFAESSMAAPDASSISPGTISVQTRVNVKFEITPKRK